VWKWESLPSAPPAP